LRRTNCWMRRRSSRWIAPRPATTSPRDRRRQGSSMNATKRIGAAALTTYPSSLTLTARSMSRAAWHHSERTPYLPQKQRGMSIEAGATHHTEVIIPPHVTPQSHSTSLNRTRAALARTASARCKPRTRCRNCGECTQLFYLYGCPASVSGNDAICRLTVTIICVGRITPSPPILPTS
jgi:hypothetical protein